MTEADFSLGTRSSGDLIDAMYAAVKQDRRDLHAAVARLIGHDSPVVRETVISVLLAKWRDDRYRNLAVHALTTDPEFGVRCTAAIGLGGISSASTRSEDILLLAHVLRAEHIDIEVRRSAYEGLFLIDGREDFLSYRKTFVPDRDVDFPWLERLEADALVSINRSGGPRWVAPALDQEGSW